MESRKRGMKVLHICDIVLEEEYCVKRPSLISRSIWYQCNVILGRGSYEHDPDAVSAVIHRSQKRQTHSPFIYHSSCVSLKLSLRLCQPLSFSFRTRVRILGSEKKKKIQTNGFYRSSTFLISFELRKSLRSNCRRFRVLIIGMPTQGNNHSVKVCHAQGRQPISLDWAWFTNSYHSTKSSVYATLNLFSGLAQKEHSDSTVPPSNTVACLGQRFVRKVHRPLFPFCSLLSFYFPPSLFHFNTSFFWIYPTLLLSFFSLFLSLIPSLCRLLPQRNHLAFKSRIPFIPYVSIPLFASYRLVFSFLGEKGKITLACFSDVDTPYWWTNV